MSKCFIEGMGGGRKNTPSIFVIYPEGSICTCTKDSKVYKAKDTSGYWYFAGLSIGTWTVTITDPTGENEARSEVVEITTESQGEILELYYELYIIKNGVLNEKVFSIEKTVGNATTVTSENGLYTMTNKHATTGTAGGIWLSAINLAEYARLTIEVASHTGRFVVGVNENTTDAIYDGGPKFAAKAATTDAGTDTVLNVDISALDDATAYYTCVGTWQAQNVTHTTAIRNLYFSRI